MPSVIVTLPTDAHSFRFSYGAHIGMNTPNGTTSSTSSSFADGLNSVLSTLFPPKPSLRLRSLSNASSRSVTPVPSPAPSTPILCSPSSEEELELPPIFQLTPRIIDSLDARDILHLSQAAKGFRKLRSSETFQRHLMLNGWDTEALVRRSEMTKDSKGRPWMFLARSAIQKDDILRHYALLPKVAGKESLLKDKKHSVTVKNVLRVLMDAVTEHEQHNFSKLTSLANSLQLSFIQFVTPIPVHHWKARYQKTFIIAAYTNAYPISPDSADHLERFSETLSFDHSNPPLLFLAARANLLYTYACMSYSKASPHPLQSSDYDEPHLITNSSSLPGLRQGIERFTRRIAISGFYRKASGGASPMRVAFEPIGLASRSRLPFMDKDLLTLNATVSDGDGNPPWEMSGSIDRNTGVGKIKTTSGMVYDIWVTPWGLTGQKLRGEGKHLGYFVLHWA